MEEKDLRELLRAPGTRRLFRWRCLNENTLAAFADGHLEGPARLRAEGHLAACLHCRTQLSDLVRLNSLETLPEVPRGLFTEARELAAAQRGAPGATRAWQWSLVASAVAVALLVVAIQRHKPMFMPAHEEMEGSPSRSAPTVTEPAPEPERLRSATPQSTVPALLSPQEGATMASKHSAFRWTAVPGTLSYEVEVLTIDGNVAWTGRTKATHLTIPENAALRQGEYFVWVRAHLADGKTSKSQAMSFRISAE